MGGGGEGGHRLATGATSTTNNDNDETFFSPPTSYQPTCSYSKVTVVGVKVQNCPANEFLLPVTSQQQRLSGSMRNSSSDGALCPSPLPLDPLADDEDVVLPSRYNMT